MTPFAHLSAGYLVAQLSRKKVAGLLSKRLIILLAILGAFAPDIDGFFGNKMNNHRYTPFHAPLFWFLIFVIGYIGGIILKKPEIKTGILIFTISVFSHLFLDWISARTGGIRIFYPFSKKIYSLFHLKPEKGNITVLPNKKHLQFWLFYLENKFLIGVEVLVILAGLLVFIFNA